MVERQYRNTRLEQEHVAEFSYQPSRCKGTYRVIVLRKTLAVEKGQLLPWKDIRYFFYITTIPEMSPAAVVYLCNDRCNQENLIEQLKHGLNAMRMPVNDLVANWSYIVMASLAWTLKAWFVLLVRYQEQRTELLCMEFRRFLNAIIWLPVQIITAGRRIIYRILGYNDWVHTFLTTCDTIRQLRLA